MIPARYRWDWKQPDEQLAMELSAKLGIPPLTARVLVARGWSEEEAADFFRPADEAALEDPLRMKGMPEAAERIRKAIKDGERVRIYGDYDADGVTSTALMTRLLAGLGARFDTYIPHRSQEGYGLNVKAVDLAADAGVSLIVTVDNGISAVEQIAYARERGIDVVVTDHHEPPSVLPEAFALVNPKQPDCAYSFKGLCGAGVAFKLAHVLLGRPAMELADLAAIGTIADLMPLIGENRIIVRMGLESMRRRPSPGIRALAAVSGTEPGELTSGKIGFALAPRLNAGGRLERADGALKLLTTDDEQEAVAMARDLDRLNAERQKLVDATVDEAEQMWRQKKVSFGGDGPQVIVLSGEQWNAGIAGLVASKLVERHYRPAVILAVDAGTGKCRGSARSIDGFDLYAALTECSDFMDHYGGHQAAAGMTLDIARIAELEEKLHRLAGEWLLPEDWQPKKSADLICSLEETTLAAAEALARLEPFGNGHPTPRIMLLGVKVRESRVVGKEGKHIRLAVEQAGRTLEAIGFGIGSLADRLREGRTVDLLGELTVNEWNGTKRVQMTLQDLKCDEIMWVDRRNELHVWPELEKLAAQEAEGFFVVCANGHLAADASERENLRGAVIHTYGERPGRDDGALDLETAAAREATWAHPSRAGMRRRLALLGLPDNEQDLESLAGWLSAENRWEAIHLFKIGSSGVSRAQVLERQHFAQVYAQFRRQGTWIDGPEGFLRQIADRTGLPFSAVRLVQEVFEELGFVRASGAERKIVAEPPRRKLEESKRYNRMFRQSEAASFAEWPLARIKEWAALVSARTKSV